MGGLGTVAAATGPSCLNRPESQSAALTSLLSWGPDSEHGSLPPSRRAPLAQLGRLLPTHPGPGEAWPQGSHGAGGASED